MPDTSQLNDNFKHLQIKELHPTFAAEVSGVDFTNPIPNDVFDEILAASAKVVTISDHPFRPTLTSISMVLSCSAPLK